MPLETINNEILLAAIQEQEFMVDRSSFRSEAVQEIISRKPDFWGKWAMPIFLLILLLFFVAAWLIKYPDIIDADASLTAPNTPKEIVIKQEGRLLKLFIRNDDTVVQGQTIAWLESLASHAQIIALGGLLEKGNVYLSTNDVKSVVSIFSRKFDNLGELQPAYQQFILSLQRYNDYYKRIGILQKNLRFSQQKLIFQQALLTLKSLVDEWENKYILRAAETGKVVFTISLQENQYILSGKTIGYVIPSNSQYYVQVTLRQSNFGKVVLGQRVQLRFDSYPYQEFGTVEGILSYISNAPSDSGFLADISLPKGLVTNYGREIQYRNGLKCEAMIITNDVRILHRFYYSLLKGIQR